MTEKNIFTRIRIPFFLCLLIAVHSFLMNGHHHIYPELNIGTYIDPIVAKADPSLFKNSLYVQAVNRTNVRLSLFYDASGFIIKYFDFETFIIVQEFISLFFMLAGIFTLTKVLFASSFAGYAAALLFTVELNNWTLGSPAPYLNFFHHGLPYAYPLVLWSLVFFFQKRYIPAFIFAGLAWNFHPMCTIFVLWAYFVYLLFKYKNFTAATLLLCAAAFIIPALPILIRAYTYLNNTNQLDLGIWLTTVRWTAWYTCFPATWPALWILRAGLFFSLFLVALYAIPDNSKKRDILIFISSVGILCFSGTVFADVYPIPFVIKLSLWRSTIVYLFLALPCIAYFLTELFNDGIGKRFLAISVMVLLTGYLKCFKLYYFPLFIVFLIYTLYEQRLVKQFSILKNKFSLLFFTSTAVLFCAGAYRGHFSTQSLNLLLFFSFTLLFLVITNRMGTYMIRKPLVTHKRVTAVVFIFIVLFDCAVLYSRGGPDIYYHGKIRGKVDPWAEVQMAANKLSDKDDLFIIPPYLNDFGLYSQRATLGDWAEGANTLYLDNQFALDWYFRMNDLGWKKLHGAREGYNNLTTQNVLRVAKKYRAKFIVSERPKTFELPKLYENEKFILYWSETSSVQ
jgi:hypothetical protein